MPHKIRVDTEDLQSVRVGTYIGEDMTYQGKPFTGFEIHGYYENEQAAGETEYIDGEQMGWVIEFYDNGFVERERDVKLWGQLRYILMNLIEMAIKQ